MNLIYFTKEAYKLLKKDLNLNKSNYFSEEPWLDEYFANAGLDEFYRTSSIAVPNIELISTRDDTETKNKSHLFKHPILFCGLLYAISHLKIIYLKDGKKPMIQ